LEQDQYFHIGRPQIQINTGEYSWGKKRAVREEIKKFANLTRLDALFYDAIVYVRAEKFMSFTSRSEAFTMKGSIRSK
jgi:hypothetical protein